MGAVLQICSLVALLVNDNEHILGGSFSSREVTSLSKGKWLGGLLPESVRDVANSHPQSAIPLPERGEIEYRRLGPRLEQKVALC